MRRITTTKPLGHGRRRQAFTDRYLIDGGAHYQPDNLERIRAPHSDEYGTEEEVSDYGRDTTPDVLEMMKGSEK